MQEIWVQTKARVLNLFCHTPRTSSETHGQIMGTRRSRKGREKVGYFPQFEFSAVKRQQNTHTVMGKSRKHPYFVTLDVRVRGVQIKLMERCLS